MNLQQDVQERLLSWVSRRSRLLCAVSGGPDSVALGHLLKTLSFTVVWGHVDHQIRGNSYKDAQFVKALARRWDVPCRVARVSVPAHARSQGVGLEEAARDLRYAALVRMARRSRCSAIVTAHHLDDQAETVLMNFLRGSGPAGLAGIPPQREAAPGLAVLRPLLGTTRREILAYLKENRLPFLRDPSNDSLRFTRNRIRHETFPLLERSYPGLRRRLGQLGDILRVEEDFWNRQIGRKFKETVRKNRQSDAVDLARLFGYHKALSRRILRRLLKGASFQDVERVYQLAQGSCVGLSFELPGGWRVSRKEKALIVENLKNHE